ncbi:MAG: UMP kinase [Treponema sp.]|jgi:uridylate kinase|nr:UMP kinase [Treponema sp.]
MLHVISLGGSIVAPGAVDEAYLGQLLALLERLLLEDGDRRFIFVVGGGGPARAWQRAYRNLARRPSDDEADWIGVMATRLNAQLIKALMGDWCREEVVTDPSRTDSFRGRVLVAAGWKPGFSSDYDAVLLAERFKAAQVINLSNIEQVYTDDPRKNPDAKPIKTIGWADFIRMVGDEWAPGKNVPFDPVASHHAATIGLRVLFAAGKNLDNLEKILRGGDFLGTVIGGPSPGH